MVFTSFLRRWRSRGSWAISLVILMLAAIPASSQRERSDADDRKDNDTETPIKHVIVIIGENHTFYNIFATYQPKHGTVANLLSNLILRPHPSSAPNPPLS